MSVIGVNNDINDFGRENSYRSGQGLGENCVPSSSRLAGFPSETGHHSTEPGPVDVRPLSTQWLTDERIAEARRVWSKAYGRVISEEEAIEILMNVRRLAEVLLPAEEGKKS